MKGELAGQPKTPIIFSYDMQTGLLSINNICHEKEGILTINANQATTPLFSLSAFNNLKDHNVTFKDVRSEQTDTTVNFQKNTIELHIEKNRTLTYLTENFDIATKTQYDKANSKGIMHLFQILEKSFVKPDEHRLLRKNLQRLNKLIGKEDVKQISTETAEKKAEPHTDDKLLVQQDEKILTDLNSHFNSEKRKTDIKQLNTSDDSSNGIYTFLREFTTNINNKAPTDYNENQKLDLNKMSARLSELEQKQANQNLITYNEKITDEEREEADKTLTDKLNDFPSA